jgi:hypothetical protein
VIQAQPGATSAWKQTLDLSSRVAKRLNARVCAVGYLSGGDEVSQRQDQFVGQ